MNARVENNPSVQQMTPAEVNKKVVNDIVGRQVFERVKKALEEATKAREGGKG